MNCEKCGHAMVQIGDPFESIEPLQGQLVNVVNTEFACPTCIDIRFFPVCPGGYKAVIHRACGGLHSWVKSSVQPGDPIRAADIVLVNDVVPEPHMAVPNCPSCGGIVTGTSLTIQ